MLNVHRNRTAYYGRGEGGGGGGGGGEGVMEVRWGGGGGGEGRLLNLSRHCHHQNDSCIRMGSDESHFNVSLIVTEKSQDSVHAETTIFEEKGEPKRIRTDVPLLTSLMPYR